MPAASTEIQHRPAKTAAERMRAWRERNRAASRVKRVTLDIGPAIAEGEPFVDDFDWCDSEWARRLAGARFSDVEPRRPATE